MLGRPPPPPRKRYRHGDLHRTLLETAVTLAREAGPDAVILRETTRRAGVAPNAAYRHFASREALLDAVRDVALSHAARSMEEYLAALGPPRATAAFARASLRAVGMGYLHFARSEPGLFRTAFAVRFVQSEQDRPTRHGRSGLNPFQLLAQSLDRMQAASLLSPVRRRGAEYLAWSAVHGMAMLYIDGPLKLLSAESFSQLASRLVHMVDQGITNDQRAVRIRRAAQPAMISR